MKNKLLKILAQIRPEVDYKTSNNFIEDGFLDSLDIIRLVAEIDDQFNISINGGDILPENFISFNAILGLIKKSGG